MYKRTAARNVTVNCSDCDATIKLQVRWLLDQYRKCPNDHMVCIMWDEEGLSVYGMDDDLPGETCLEYSHRRRKLQWLETT